MIPIIGKLGDIYGRKWFIVGGIVVFLARPRAKRRSPRARRRALS
jgi:MFS family permease